MLQLHIAIFEFAGILTAGLQSCAPNGFGSILLIERNQNLSNADALPSTKDGIAFTQ